jgi:hypothetical protein
MNTEPTDAQPGQRGRIVDAEHNYTKHNYAKHNYAKHNYAEPALGHAC